MINKKLRIVLFLSLILLLIVGSLSAGYTAQPEGKGKIALVELTGYDFETHCFSYDVEWRNIGVDEYVISIIQVGKDPDSYGSQLGGGPLSEKLRSFSASESGYYFFWYEGESGTYIATLTLLDINEGNPEKSRVVGMATHEFTVDPQ